MRDNITFYNKIFYMINGGILGNFTGILYYINTYTGVYSLTDMIDSGTRFAVNTVCVVYIISRLRELSEL